jgi:hypothetical protein
MRKGSVCFMDFVGTTRIHPKYGKYVVEKLTRTVKEQGYKKYYIIRFLDTGFSYETDRNTIRQNQVKDYFFPQVYGVGYLGEDYNSVDRKISNLWRGVLGRCYSSTNASYKNYGGKSVTVCEQWLNYSNFARDIKKIKGYIEEDFYNGKLHLDKDILQPNVDNKVYSKETCMFVNPSRNMEEQPATRTFKALSPDGKVYEGKNIKKFCEEHDLDYVQVYAVMNKKNNYRHKGWVFGDKNESLDSLLKKQTHRMKKFFAVNIEEGTLERVIGLNGFASEHGLSQGNISMCLSGRRKTPYGDWKFFNSEEEAEKFLKGLGAYP